jgi:hypothetical protein
MTGRESSLAERARKDSEKAAENLARQYRLKVLEKPKPKAKPKPKPKEE